MTRHRRAPASGPPAYNSPPVLTAVTSHCQESSSAPCPFPREWPRPSGPGLSLGDQDPPFVSFSLQISKTAPTLDPASASHGPTLGGMGIFKRLP